MLTRVISSIVALPLLFFFILSGELILKIGLFTVCIIGMSEIYRTFGVKYSAIHLIGYFACFAYIMGLDTISLSTFYIILSLFFLILLIFIVINYNNSNFSDILVSIFAFFYVPFLLSSVYFIRDAKNGIYLIWIVFISAWISDTGAYFVGVMIGKNKLIPQLSPAKTIEGSIGGIICAILGGVLYNFIITEYFSYPKESTFIQVVAIISAVSAIFGQLGDLVASSIKRHNNVKDFGKIMPGHGGFIDRFDSVIFTAPVVYILLMLLGVI